MGEGDCALSDKSDFVIYVLHIFKWKWWLWGRGERAADLTDETKSNGFEHTKACGYIDIWAWRKYRENIASNVE